MCNDFIADWCGWAKGKKIPGSEQGEEACCIGEFRYGKEALLREVQNSRCLSRGSGAGLQNRVMLGIEGAQYISCGFCRIALCRLSCVGQLPADRAEWGSCQLPANPLYLQV